MKPVISSKFRIGLLGSALSFHDLVRKKYHPNNPHTFYTNFRDIFHGLDLGHIDCAILATENSIHGLVNDNLAQIKTRELDTIAHYTIPIKLHLGSKASIKKKDIQKVYANPIAFEECQKMLKSIPDYEFVKSTSNSSAVEDMINDSDPFAAAISNKNAIEAKELQFIARDIQDSEDNCTTFVLVKRNNP